jgi:hypothetical protein
MAICLLVIMDLVLALPWTLLHPLQGQAVYLDSHVCTIASEHANQCMLLFLVLVNCVYVEGSNTVRVVIP